jgi:hypothetical protein
VHGIFLKFYPIKNEDRKEKKKLLPRLARRFIPLYHEMRLLKQEKVWKELR